MVCIKFSRGRHPRGDGKLDARKKIRWKKPVKNALITSIVDKYILVKEEDKLRINSKNV